MKRGGRHRGETMLTDGETNMQRGKRKTGRRWDTERTLKGHQRTWNITT